MPEQLALDVDEQTGVYEAAMPETALIDRFALGCEDADFRHFVIRQVYETTGKVKSHRDIWEQNEPMRTVHERLLAFMRQFDDRIAPEAVGGVRGISALDNVKRHAGNRHFYLLDLTDAFDQARADRLAPIMHELMPVLGETDQIERFLNRYAMRRTNGSGLVTGATSSVELFNMFLRPLDDELRELCGELGVTYSRFIDDFTFSTASGTTLGKQKRRHIRSLIKDYGLVINHRKSGVYDLTSDPVIINGIQINPDGSHRATTAWLRRSARELDSIPPGDYRDAMVAGLNGHITASRGKDEPHHPKEVRIRKAITEHTA